ncbi:MAG: hypothetical protein IJS60_02890 [Abditibacteriota bacterium]|nr:hypothetical protein [Abditibacteriota bacterium]
MKKNIWIELIGFDKNKRDYGVKAYINNCGFVPNIVSLLLTSLDILHFYEGYVPEQSIPRECASYNGRERSVERDRQDWTYGDLFGLVKELHKHNIKVMPAFFTFSYSYGNESFYRKEWIREHEELFEIVRDGEVVPVNNPLKRFKDGSYYEDFFFEKLSQFLKDLDFDGWHACDGWGPARIPIYFADFSFDMIDQFVSHSSVFMPKKLLENNNKPKIVRERADYIWENYKKEWADFYSWRWCEFHKKAVKLLKGKFIYVNSAWTRDPIEAFYRYGLDYKELLDVDITGFVVECVGSASDLIYGGKSRHFTFSSAMMFMKTIMPKAKILFLHGIKDIEEQWDVLRHNPNMLQREIYSLFNQYYISNGKVKPCADGLVCCLGDSIFKDEWKWLRKNWKMAEKSFPKKIEAPVVVLSHNYLKMSAYKLQNSLRIDPHNLFSLLCEKGSFATGGIDVRELDNYKGDILVLFRDLFPADEKEIINNYKGGKVICIDERDGSFVLKVAEAIKAREKVKIQNKPSSVPLTYVDELKLMGPGDDFINAAVSEINKNEYFDIFFDKYYENDKNDIGVLNYQFIDDRTLRCVLRNDLNKYIKAVITPKKMPKDVKIITDFPVVRLKDFNQFKITVPNKGIVIFDMIYQ